ncbi:PREDICTED: histidine-containing phosphotransfer protein 1-like [Nelumbo nucifera]|uniref:Histidine-containing phosphotransfer protein n=1 Tax=Nelumbo nucifera TaxID=4432 RepID=A0A1U7Z7S2_NELNU|nr:PREDICTED: histidine-containing phosphotransfer protein 1-like [Nelumbo nucifera]
MSILDLKARLRAHIQSLFDEGILDSLQFAELQSLQELSDPAFVANTLATFLNDSQRALAEMSKILDRPIVDYQRLKVYVMQVKGSSLSIGARLLVLACTEFIRVSSGHFKDGCIRALNRMKNEHYHLQCQLETIIQVYQPASSVESCSQSETGQDRALFSSTTPSSPIFAEAQALLAGIKLARSSNVKNLQNLRIFSDNSNLVQATSSNFSLKK